MKAQNAETGGMMEAIEKRYPALMAYIAVRSADTKWCTQLHIDENDAFTGAFADVVSDMERARADYKTEQEAIGRNGYPYNSSMGLFLGLPLRSNNEPPHGYYMASCLVAYYRLGVATREVEELLANGANLRITAAKSKATGKPIRYYTFTASQITFEGTGISANDGKRKIRLDSNWSTETCMEAVALALRTGNAYGVSQ